MSLIDAQYGIGGVPLKSYTFFTFLFLIRVYCSAYIQSRRRGSTWYSRLNKPSDVFVSAHCSLSRHALTCLLIHPSMRRLSIALLLEFVPRFVPFKPCFFHVPLTRNSVIGIHSTFAFDQTVPVVQWRRAFPPGQQEAWGGFESRLALEF